MIKKQINVGLTCYVLQICIVVMMFSALQCQTELLKINYLCSSVKLLNYKQKTICQVFFLKRLTSFHLDLPCLSKIANSINEADNDCRKTLKQCEQFIHSLTHPFQSEFYKQNDVVIPLSIPTILFAYLRSSSSCFRLLGTETDHCGKTNT
jgi:hypothetical protein